MCGLFCCLLCCWYYSILIQFQIYTFLQRLFIKNDHLKQTKRKHWGGWVHIAHAHSRQPSIVSEWNDPLAELIQCTPPRHHFQLWKLHFHFHFKHHFPLSTSTSNTFHCPLPLSTSSTLNFISKHNKLQKLFKYNIKNTMHNLRLLTSMMLHLYSHKRPKALTPAAPTPGPLLPRVKTIRARTVSNEKQSSRFMSFHDNQRSVGCVKCGTAYILRRWAPKSEP